MVVEIVQQEQSSSVQSLEMVTAHAHDALQGTRAQIEATQVRITTHHAGLKGLEYQLARMAEAIPAAEAARIEGEDRLRQAKMAAQVAADTHLEGSARMSVQQHEMALTRLIEGVTRAKEDYSKSERKAAKDRTEMQRELEKDQAELATLQRQADELETLYRARYSELGEALYKAYADEMAAHVAQVKQLEGDLALSQLQLLNLEDDAQKRLKNYPDLLKRARSEVLAAPKQEQPPTIKLIRVQIRYLQALIEHGKAIESTPHTNITKAKMMFQVPPALLERSNLGDTKPIHAWISELEEYQRQLEQQERDRASWRSQGRYVP